MHGIAVGPFEIVAPIGRGGMGVVFSAVHPTERVTVAVKIVEVGVDAGRRALFHREVRAIAGLDHPHIVQVLDYGALPPEARRAGLEPGAPWLAMELADATLADRAPGGWTEAREVLLALLDALAHAHARDVVHCDLKASNVLVGGGRPGVKLADFGIAHALGRLSLRDGFEGQSAGTPAYMAPEQFLGDPRDLGPWTDLYALGCLAWKLVTGSPPWRGDYAPLAHAHLNEPLPRLLPRYPVPNDLEAWLRGLLQKDVALRCGRAADAAWQLHQLVGPAGGGAARALESDLPTLPVVSLRRPLTLAWAPAQVARMRPAETRRRVASLPEPPPMPESWRRGEVDRPALAGLGLFGLRSVPLIDRVAERDRLWEGLKQARAGRTVVVALVGAPGSGKTRLARWIARRAHEIGSAEVLTATHGPVPHPDDGVAAMAARALATTGLPHARVLERLEGLLGGEPTELEPLAALLAPEDAPVALERPRDRHVALARLVHRLAGGRAVVLVVDDLQWGADAAGFVRHLLDAPEPLPLLVVLTARLPCQLADARTLLDDPRVDRLALGPLAPADHRLLVRSLLPLDPALADAIAVDTAGSPLTAEQIIQDLVEDDALRPGPRGHVLARPDRPDAAQVWIRRVDRHCPVEARAGVELAAALGRAIDEGEWQAVCRAAGVVADGRVVEQLARAGLARIGVGGWSFAHEVLREAIVQRVDRERWRRWNALCAEVVADPGREGLHRLEAGEPLAAIDPLLTAIATHRFDPARTALLLDRCEEALGAAPPSDDRHGRAALARAQLLRFRGDVIAAEERVRACLEAADRYGWALGRAARIDLAMALHQRAAFDEAAELLRQARTSAAAAGETRVAMTARLREALLAVDAGLPEDALAAATEVLPYFEREGDRLGAGYACTVLGTLALRRGDTTDAVGHCERARSHLHAAGDRVSQADASNYLASALFAAGRLDEAEAAFRTALDLYRLLGLWDVLLVRINLALVAHARGELGRARESLEEALRSLRIQPRAQFEGAVRAFLLPCVAADGDWEAFAVHLAEARRLLAETGFVDPDVDRLAEEAADRADAAGRADLAAGARALVRR